MFSLAELRHKTSQPGDRLPVPGWQPADRLRLPTGLASLDAVLGGGLALGQLIEISGAVGAGRSSLALSLGLQSLLLGGAVAWIEPDLPSAPTFWPLQPLEAGLPLERLLLVRVKEGEQLRAAQILLSSPGAVQILVIDWGGRREIRAHQLLTLHRLSERSMSLVLFLTERTPAQPSLGPLVGVRLHLRQASQGERLSSLSLAAGSGTQLSSPSAAGGGQGGGTPSSFRPTAVFDRPFEVEVLRHKRGPSRGHFPGALHGPDRLRLRSTL